MVEFKIRLDNTGKPGDRKNKKYIRLPPPLKSTHETYRLKFIILAGSDASSNACLHTNYPISGETFDRHTFTSIPFTSHGLSDLSAVIEIETPGVFDYVVTHGTSSCLIPTGSFVVDPSLSTITRSGPTSLPLDAISMLTVIPKWLPQLSQWLPFFTAFAASGYNFVHFAPLNTRGISNSPYSIYDQLALSPDLFEDESLNEVEKEVKLVEVLDEIRRCGILSATDAVWNHTAYDHPEAGYNVKNSPHLRPALEIDTCLMEFSSTLSETYPGIDLKLCDEATLCDIMNVWRDLEMPKVRLWEFYVVDVDNCVKEFELAWQVSDVGCDDRDAAGMTLKQQAEYLKECAFVDYGFGTRYARTINIDRAIICIRTIIASNPHTSPSHLLKHLLDEVNVAMYLEFNDDAQSIHDQIRNRARYLRVSEHGPRLGPISRDLPLVDTYFTRLNEEKCLDPDERAIANNGWIWNADPLVNFAGKGSRAYLRREVIAWVVEINVEEDNVWLWEHMAAYTVKMAGLFDGFRIDNCHSTPIHVAMYLLDVARSVKKDLYVFAELFTGSEETDVMFVSKLGINSLIRVKNLS